MKRHRVNKAKSSRQFRKNTSRTKRINMNQGGRRGGFRL